MLRGWLAAMGSRICRMPHKTDDIYVIYFENGLSLRRSNIFRFQACRRTLCALIHTLRSAHKYSYTRMQ